MRLLPLLRFVRLPLAFTAIGDVAAGYWIGLPQGEATRLSTLGILGAASACLYMTGMALNDLADRERDAAIHPDRPLPSRTLDPVLACLTTIALPATGVALLSRLPQQAFLCGIALLLAAVAYDLGLKRFAAVGSLAIGACRGLNLAMGAAVHGPAPLQPSVILGTYVAVLTLVSTLEEKDPKVERYVRWGLLGILPLDALLVGLYAGRWAEAGIILSLLAGRIILGRYIPTN